MVNWGTMDTKSVKGKIRLEKAVEDDVYKYEIDKVWVQFRGLPKELREFPIIWAIGSILGVSKAVDTKFTKNHGRSRMKVAVIDPSLIPNLVDVVIGDFVYELQFRVEEDMPDGEPMVINMDSTMEEDPKEGEPKEKNKEEVEPEEKSKEDDNMDVDGSKKNNTTPNQQASKIDAPKEKPSGQVPTAAPLAAGCSSSPSVQKPVVVLAADASGSVKASSLKPIADFGILSQKKLKIGGTVSPVRTSKRSAAIGDQDSVEKASKLKARKNLESALVKGSFQGHALASALSKAVAT